VIQTTVIGLSIYILLNIIFTLISKQQSLLSISKGPIYMRSVFGLVNKNVQTSSRFKFIGVATVPVAAVNVFPQSPNTTNKN
jgi:hypothetical protein